MRNTCRASNDRAVPGERSRRENATAGSHDFFNAAFPGKKLINSPTQGERMVEVSRDEASLEKSARMREGNISLILEGYHDIFSNFDPRPYSEKALSDDFLSECRRAARDKDEQRLELRFMIPKARRDTAEENKIKHRLKEHFHKHYREEQRAEIGRAHV